MLSGSGKEGDMGSGIGQGKRKAVLGAPQFFRIWSFEPKKPSGID
jgi:hypothetical protein